MTQRVAVGGLFHETNTFACPTTLEDFTVLRGGDIEATYKGTRTYLGGMFAGLAEAEIKAIPIVYAEATPSGTITGSTLEALLDELVDGVDAANPDAVLLAIHGAGVADGTDSIEETLCEALRARLGEAIPIVATLDLHGNLRPELAGLCSGLFPVRTNPHVDQFERGSEAAVLVSALLNGCPAPHTVIEQLPVLIPPTATSNAILTAANDMCEDLEAGDRMLAVRLMHGFPYADLPHLGMSVVAVAQTREDASIAARIVAENIWQHREELRFDRLSADQAVELALRTPRPVLINEFSDNTGAGAPGDGTHLLRALIGAGVPACFSHVFDPDTVALAHRSDVGASIETNLGGKHDARHGKPLHVRAEIRSLGTGQFRVKSPMGTGEPIDLGRLCALRIGPVDVVVTSGRRQTLDDGPFIRAGIDIAEYPIVAVKSSQHFRAFFEATHTIVTANPPGISNADVAAFDRPRLQRPVWPLNPELSYSPTRERCLRG